MCEPDPRPSPPYVYYPGGENYSIEPTGIIDMWDKKLTTDLPNLTGYEPDKLAILPEPFSHVTFEDALAHINPANSILGDGTYLVSDTADYGLMLDHNDPRRAGELEDVRSSGLGLADKWGAVRDKIALVTSNFSDALDSLMNDKEHWDGQTKLSAFENVRKSFQAPDLISQSAGVMQKLVDGFTRTVEYVYQNIEGNRPSYLMNVKARNPENDYERSLDELINEYNTFARKVLGETYAPNIELIAAGNPKFTTGDLPDLGGDEPPPPTGPGPGGGGDIPPFSGGGPVSTPDFKTPTLPTGLPTGPDGLPTGPDGLPTGPDGLPTGPGLGDPTQAASAVPQGLGGPSPAGGPTPAGVGKDPREGALGLGPRGLGGPLKKVGGAGGGGGVKGGAGGAGRGPLGGRTASVPVTPAGRAGVPAAAPGAGLSSGAGTPGMVPPMAGQRGGDQNGKGHQTMKALRRKKTGEEVMGTADAVVPVVGETERPEPAQPEPEDVQPERRRGTDPPVLRIATGDVHQVP